jgi:hypothetical protein
MHRRLLKVIATTVAQEAAKCLVTYTLMHLIPAVAHLVARLSS